MRGPDPRTNYKRAGLIAIIFALILLSSWEYFWRTQGKLPDINDGKELWAIQRGKVDELGKDDVVLLGSSRVLFDVQVDEWESMTGNRPLQLATAGGHPLPAFRDIVRESEFNGIAVIGVAPDIFFETTEPGFFPWKRMESRVKYFHERTWADRFNYWLSVPLDKNLVLAAASEESYSDNIDLRSLIGSWFVGDRTKKPHTPFYSFGKIDRDRNMRMTERTATDTAFANTVIKAWGVEEWLKEMKGEGQVDEESDEENEERTEEFDQKEESEEEMPDISGVIAYFSEDVERFEKRGGRVIMVRCPSNGAYREVEALYLPRDTAWDVLLETVQLPGIHFEDFSQLDQFYCPELSHLSAPDADIFTRELVKILQDKGLLSKPKPE